MLFAAKDDENKVSSTRDTITITDEHETKIIKTNGSVLCKKTCMLKSDSFKIRMSSNLGAHKPNKQGRVTIRWEARLSLELKTTHKFFELLSKMWHEPITWCGILGMITITIMTILCKYAKTKLDHAQFRFKPTQNNRSTNNPFQINGLPDLVEGSV